MKILHVAGTVRSIMHFRGPLLVYLQEEGVENWITGSEHISHNVKDIKDSGYSFYPIKLRGFGSLNLLLSILMLSRLIRRERFTIVHTNTPLGGLVGRLAAIFSMKKVVIFHTTGGIPLTPESWSVYSRIYFWIEKVLASKTSYIFSPSKRDISRFIDNGVNPINKFVHCGPAGFKPEEYIIENKLLFKNGVYKEFGLEDSTILIGIVARMVVDKGIYDFLDVAQKLWADTSIRKNLSFILIGDGPLLEELKENFEKENLVFLGRRYDIPRLMMSMDIFLFPSRREGYPVAVVEAKASGTSVVAYDIDGCREAIVDGEDGVLVPYQNNIELAKAVKELINNDVLRESIGRAARSNALQNATVNNHTSKHSSIYNKYI